MVWSLKDWKKNAKENKLHALNLHEGNTILQRYLRSTAMKTKAVIISANIISIFTVVSLTSGTVYDAQGMWLFWCSLVQAGKHV